MFISWLLSVVPPVMQGDNKWQHQKSVTYHDRGNWIIIKTANNGDNKYGNWGAVSLANKSGTILLTCCLKLLLGFSWYLIILLSMVKCRAEKITNSKKPIIAMVVLLAAIYLGKEDK